jgi:hypothetical protein
MHAERRDRRAGSVCKDQLCGFIGSNAGGPRTYRIADAAGDLRPDACRNEPEGGCREGLQPGR